MNRRGFLGALLKGAVAVTVASKIPAEWIPVREVRECVALEYLRKRYNEYCAPPVFPDNMPTALVVGQELWDAAETEMVANTRFLYTRERETRPHIMFKGTPLVAEGHGWRIVRFEHA